MEIQFIGADLGRGYVKGYSEYNGKPLKTIFKSIIGDARQIDSSEHEHPIHLRVNGIEFFVGEMAESESYNPINNYSDDKTSNVAEKLLYALLSEVAESERVKICLGVPNKTFNEETIMAVAEAYKGQQIVIENLIKNTTKEVKIEDITIFRESDAALFYTVNNHKDRIALQNRPVGMVTVGFRTTEMSYFDKGMKFNDKLSKTFEIGNRTVLDIIQKSLEKSGISKSLNEIDTNNDYDSLKDKCYLDLIERLNQEVEMQWINFKEMSVFLAGGTSKKFKEVPSKFEKVNDPQMITAKGLNFVAEMRFK